MNILEDRSGDHFLCEICNGSLAPWPTRDTRPSLLSNNWTCIRKYIVSFFPRQHGVWPCLADDLILSCRPLKRHYCFVCFFRQLMMKVYIIMCKSFGHYTATPNDSLRGNMIQTVKLPSKMTSGAWDGCLEINDGFMEAVSWPILNCNVLQWESSYCYKVLQNTDSSILHRVTITMQSKAAVKKQFKYCLKIQIGKSQSWNRRREEG